AGAPSLWRRGGARTHGCRSRYDRSGELMPHQQRRRGTRARAFAGTAAMALLAAGCAGAGGTAFGGGDALNVLMVNNPQMVQLQKLTAEHFTEETGIKVH